MSSTDLYYRCSGRFPAHGLAVMLIGGLAAAGIAGAVYGVVTWYMPIIYVNVLLTLGLGLGCGWLVLKLGMAMHVRNTAAYLAVAFATALAAYYANWVSWIWAASGREDVVVLPTQIAAVMQIVYEQGAWSMGSSGEPVKGVFLGAIWVAEAAVVLGAPFKVVWRIRDEPYCETTGAWVNEVSVIGPFTPIEEPDGWRRALEAGEFAKLGALRPLGGELGDGGVFAQIKLRHAGAPESLHVLTIANVTVHVDKEGKVKLKEKPVVRDMIIDHESHELINELAEELAEAAGAEETAEPTAGATEPALDEEARTG